MACKIIGEEIRGLGISEMRDGGFKTNAHYEKQEGIDVFANHVITECLSSRGNVGLIASEEYDKPMLLLENTTDGKYIVVFDPLDGSSNLDVHASVGTIFSIYQRSEVPNSPVEAEILRPGFEQIAAGYVLYGSSTLFLCSTGQGVHCFTLDPRIGTFMLSHSNVRMPPHGNVYSVNESLENTFSPSCRSFIRWLKIETPDTPYRSRYIGSLVADFHRILLKGGIFMYPQNLGPPPAESCGWPTKPIRSLFWQSRRVEWRRTAVNES